MTRILIADDNTINRKLLSWQLETLGFGCDNATCGQEAIDACADTRFDLIFMDVNLGDMDGYTVTRTLRQREVDVRTPIVAVTAHVGKEEQDRCLASGMDDFLSKPITLSPLAQLLVRWGVHGYEPVADTAADGDGAKEPGSWLLSTAVTWLRSLEESAAHAGLARAIAADFLARAPMHVQRLRTAIDDGDGEKRAQSCFALRKNCIGMGAIRLADAVGQDADCVAAKLADEARRTAPPETSPHATVGEWLADIDRILAGTSAEVQREFM